MAWLLLMLIFGDQAEAPIRWTPPGEVSIVVLERQGMAPLAGAAVTLSSSEPPNVRRAVTNASGAARFRGVARGSYTVEIELSGFTSMRIGSFPVHEREKESPEIPEFLAVMNPVRWVEHIETPTADEVAPERPAPLSAESLAGRSEIAECPESF